MSYKLYYFNGRGLAEVIRLTFEANGAKYEDVRYTQETWPDAKKSKWYFQITCILICITQATCMYILCICICIAVTKYFEELNVEQLFHQIGKKKYLNIAIKITGVCS